MQISCNSVQKNNLPVIIINVNPADALWVKTRKEANMPPFPDNDTWFQITDKLQTADEDIRITKHTWNAFFETNLNDELKKRCITGIVLAGISTSIGVEGTAGAASELVYNIAFATDAMTDLKEEAHERSIKYIFPGLGETGTVVEIIDKLENK